MTYSAEQLITRAYHLASIVSRDFQTVSGSQIEEGLLLLNGLLAVKAVDKGQIPYFQEYILTPVVGQEKYFIPDLYEVQSATFNLGAIRLTMDVRTRDEYFNTSRIDNLTSLPFTYHVERTYGGSNFYIYFNPNAQYPIKIWGKFGFPQIDISELQDDLTLSYDLSYLEYLRYQLADVLCHENDTELSNAAQSKLLSLEALFKGISPYDYSRKAIVPLGGKYIDAFTRSLTNQRFGVWRP